MQTRQPLLSTCAILTCLAAAGATHAAEPASAPAAADQTPQTVSDIVVTAPQKRSQRMQDAPVVVTVATAQQLQNAGVRDIKGLSTLVPGLTVTSTTSAASTTARIRGVGTVSDNVGLEDQVGVVIDGVYRPRNGVAFGDLGELNDIEVLKGPQSTIYGKNTTAGVIDVTTQRPSFTFGGETEVDVGNFNYYGGSTSITGPIIGDELAGRLYIADRQRDGYIKVDSPPGTSIAPLNDEHMFTVRGQLLFQPNPDFDVNFIGDYTQRHEHCCAGVPIINGFESQIINAIAGAWAATDTTPNPRNYTAYNNTPLAQNITDEGFSAEAHWKTPWLGGATLTSISAIRDWKNDGVSNDADYSGLDLLSFPNNNNTEFRQYSEELRYAGETDRLNWMVGAFFGREELYNQYDLNFGNAFDPYLETLVGAASGGLADFNLGGAINPATMYTAGEGELDNYHQSEHSESLFTQEVFKVTDKLELTGGLRYTWENKSLNTLYTNTPGGGSGCAAAKGLLGPAGFAADPFSGFYCALGNDLYNHLPDHQSLAETALTGTAKADYRFNRDLMVYDSYSHGFLAGGYNLSRWLYPTGAPGDQTPNTNAFAADLNTSFAPTTVDAYEIGEKSTLFDGKVALDGAFFYQNYKSFQLNQFNGLVFVVTNVPQVISKGVEGEVDYYVTHGFSVNFGATYSDTYYADSAANRAALLPSLKYLPGSRLSLAPLWSLAGGFDYERPIVDQLVFHLSGSAKWTSSMNTGSDLDPNKVQKAYATVDARIGIGSADHRWAVELWAQNLFNQYYEQAAFNGPLQTLGVPGANTYYAFPGIPRMFGVTLRTKY